MNSPPFWTGPHTGLRDVRAWKEIAAASLAVDASRRAALLVACMHRVCALLTPCRAAASAPGLATVISFRALSDAADGHAAYVARRAAIALIAAYKYLISPWFAGSCRFVPSCADYMAEAIARHGVIKGSMLGARRLGRCHPLGSHGHDPVPLRWSIASLLPRTSPPPVRPHRRPGAN